MARKVIVQAARGSHPRAGEIGDVDTSGKFQDCEG